MASFVRINLWFCIAVLVLNVVLSSSVFKRDVLQVEQEQPVAEVQLSEDLIGGDDDVRTDRDKRFVKLAVKKKIGLKTFLLNFLFGKIDSFIDSKTRAIDHFDKVNIVKNAYYGIPPPQPPHPVNLQLFQPKPAFGLHYHHHQKQPPTSTLPPPVEFSTNSPVSLVIPDRLYGNSFSIITNISNIIGDVIFNTAGRAQELADTINEKAQTKLGWKSKIFHVETGPVTASSNSL